MLSFRKLFKWIGYTLALLLLLILLFCGYMWKVSDIKPPKIADTSAHSLQKKHIDGSLYTIGDNWIRKNKYGLYELYVSGTPYELGVKSGMLSQQLIANQQDVFAQEMKALTSSAHCHRFFKYKIAFMNRDLPGHITDEYKQELYGMSLSLPDSFDWIGSKYSRILYYQAVHDINIALPEQMPACASSFGAWGTKTSNGGLLLGQIFSFCAGDKYTENKIVAFYHPDHGHRFAFVTCGGSAGAVSGMNDRGLTVTVNMVCYSRPWGGVATPAPLVAREILQHAGNIKEAIAIAHQCKMSASANFLIGSSADHKAVIIEKAPDIMAVYSAPDHVQCTNHYQSKLLRDKKINQDQMVDGASIYRYRRLQELLDSSYPLTSAKAAAILRDRRGLHGADIGDGNSKAINQLAAQCSVIFQPDSLYMWVGTQPGQLGTYICYDLKKIFALNGLQQNMEIADTLRDIAPDTFLYSDEFKRFELFNKNRIALLQHAPVDTAQIVHSDSNFYDAYRIAGDYCTEKRWYTAAINYYVAALSRQVATAIERKKLQEKIIFCEKEYNTQAK